MLVNNGWNPRTENDRRSSLEIRNDNENSLFLSFIEYLIYLTCLSKGQFFMKSFYILQITVLNLLVNACFQYICNVRFLKIPKNLHNFRRIWPWVLDHIGGVLRLCLGGTYRQIRVLQYFWESALRGFKYFLNKLKLFLT